MIVETGIGRILIFRIKHLEIIMDGHNSIGLNDFSTKELEAELERRKQFSKKPETLDLKEIEWEHVLSYVEEGVSQLDSGLGLPKDFENELFETVMEVVYGSDIWQWWNNKVNQ